MFKAQTRPVNAFERRHEAFKRWINTQPVLPAAETAASLFKAEAATGPALRSEMRKVDRWILTETPSDQVVALAA